MSSDRPCYDYEASILKLSERLRQMRESNWSPTPRVKELKYLAEQLDKAADLLAEQRWMDVERAFDADPPPEIGIDGWPILSDPEESRKGMFQATKWRLRDIAEAARQVTEEYPNSRARPEVPYGAIAFLHVWYQCGRDRPSFYDDGEAVQEFGKVCRSAGIHLSSARLRTALAAAWKDFDGADWPPGLERILEIRQ